MEPNLVSQNQIPEIPQGIPISGNQPSLDMGMPNLPEYVQTGMQSRQGNKFTSCLLSLFPILLLVIFIFFGDRIFSFFHIENIYHFIVSLVIILILYIVGLIITNVVIKYPKDLLSIRIDRFSKKR